MSCDEQVYQDRRVSILSSTSFTCPPLKYVYMERTSTPHPKILLHILILQTWEVKFKDLKVLTLYSPSKERVYIHGILIRSIPLYKHQAPSSPRSVHYQKKTLAIAAFCFSNVFKKNITIGDILCHISQTPLKSPPIAAL